MVEGEPNGEEPEGAAVIGGASVEVCGAPKGEDDVAGGAPKGEDGAACVVEPKGEELEDAVVIGGAPVEVCGAPKGEADVAGGAPKGEDGAACVVEPKGEELEGAAVIGGAPVEVCGAPKGEGVVAGGAPKGEDVAAGAVEPNGEEPEGAAVIGGVPVEVCGAPKGEDDVAGGAPKGEDEAAGGVEPNGEEPEGGGFTGVISVLGVCVVVKKGFCVNPGLVAKRIKIMQIIKLNFLNVVIISLVMEITSLKNNIKKRKNYIPIKNKQNIHTSKSHFVNLSCKRKSGFPFECIFKIFEMHFICIGQYINREFFFNFRAIETTSGFSSKIWQNTKRNSSNVPG